MNTPKIRYIEDTVYIDKKTYDRDVMRVKDYKDKKIEKLNSIIKEARKYIEHKASIREYYMINGKEYNELLEILERANNDK